MHKLISCDGFLYKPWIKAKHIASRQNSVKAILQGLEQGTCNGPNHPIDSGVEEHFIAWPSSPCVPSFTQASDKGGRANILRFCLLVKTGIFCYWARNGSKWLGDWVKLEELEQMQGFDLNIRLLCCHTEWPMRPLEIPTRNLNFFPERILDLQQHQSKSLIRSSELYRKWFQYGFFFK